MAKLTGVKTIDMVNGEITKIAYDGAEYVRVEDGVELGDVIKVTDREHSDTTSGEFYEVFEYRGRYKAILDDEGDACYAERFTADVFRKVTADKPALDDRVTALESRVDALEGEVDAPAKPQYKTVKRHAKVGERILITNATQTGGEYSDRQVLTVRETDAYGVAGSVKVRGFDRHIYEREYEVIVEDAPAQEIEHNGATYTLVTRKAQPGDVVVFTENTSNCFTNGEAYGPAELIEGLLQVGDKDGDPFGVYKPEFNRTEANTLVYAPVAQPLQVGDYVKPLPSADDRYSVTNGKMTLGKIVVGLTFGSNDICVEVVAHAVKNEIGEEYDVLSKHFRKATDEEVAEATKPKTGDIVVITANTNGSRNKVGDIGKVGETRKLTAKVDVPEREYNGIGNWTKHFEMRLATPAEIAEYEKAAAELEKSAVFAKLGRKPGEFKKGDIVRERDSGIRVVNEVEPFGFLDHERGLTLEGGGWTYKHHCELIAPVESRVDVS